MLVACYLISPLLLLCRSLCVAFVAKHKEKLEAKRKEANKLAYKQVAITTIDNPYDPLGEPEKWYQFDCDKGYNSCCYLARLTKTSDSLSDAEYNQEVERAIDAIVRDDPLGIYVKVERIVDGSDE